MMGLLAWLTYSATSLVTAGDVLVKPDSHSTVKFTKFPPLVHSLCRRNFSVARKLPNPVLSAAWLG